MKYFFKPTALDDLKKLSKSVQNRVIDKMDFYINTSNPLKFAELIKDPRLGSFRYRVGEYRVIFDFKKDKIIILKIGHRKDIYK